MGVESASGGSRARNWKIILTYGGTEVEKEVKLTCTASELTTYRSSVAFLIFPMATGSATFPSRKNQAKRNGALLHIPPHAHDGWWKGARALMVVLVWYEQLQHEGTSSMAMYIFLSKNSRMRQEASEVARQTEENKP